MDNQQNSDDGELKPKESGLPNVLANKNKDIGTVREFATAMSYLMDDLLAGRVSPIVGNAVCKAVGKMMKAVERRRA